MRKTIKQKLLEQFEAAIAAVFGDAADAEYTPESDIDWDDIQAIARKVAFYLDL